jgi:hypothetical protein
MATEPLENAVFDYRREINSGKFENPLEHEKLQPSLIGRGDGCQSLFREGASCGCAMFSLIALGGIVYGLYQAYHAFIK